MSPRFRYHADFAAIRVQVADLAAEQAHVFRPRDLVRWGIDPEIIRPMLTRRLWVRMRHGVYVDAVQFDALTTDSHTRHRLDIAAAIAALDEPAYAFGLSAAHVRNLPLPREHDHAVHLLRKVGIDHRALVDRPLRKRQLPDVHVTGHSLASVNTDVVGGIPVVGRTLAAFSSAAALTPDWAVAIMDAACFADQAALDEMLAMADEWPLPRGISTVRAALPLVRIGAQSPLESISRVRLVRCGLPEPILQAPFADEDGLIGYGDMYWPELGVIGEADGLMKYEGGIGSVIAEKRREDRLRALGFVVVRWTWAEIMTRPDVVARRIRAAARLATVRRLGRAG